MSPVSSFKTKQLPYAIHTATVPFSFGNHPM